MKNGLRFHFDSETCLNYPFFEHFLSGGSIIFEWREFRAKTEVVFQAKIQNKNFLLNWAPDSALGSSNCAVKRHLAAVALVLSWAEFVTLVARHPNLARYNIYVTMFYRSVDDLCPKDHDQFLLVIFP